MTCSVITPQSVFSQGDIEQFNYSIGDIFYYRQYGSFNPDAGTDSYWGTDTRYTIEAKQQCEECYIYSITGVLRKYSGDYQRQTYSAESMQFHDTIFYCPGNIASWLLKNSKELKGSIVNGIATGISIPTEAAILGSYEVTTDFYPKAFMLDNYILYESDTAGILIATPILTGNSLIASVNGLELVPDCESNTDNEYFKVVGTKLYSNSSFNFTTRLNYIVRLKATNYYGRPVIKTFQLELRSGQRPLLNDIRLSNSVIAESLPIGSPIGKIMALSGDTELEPFTAYVQYTSQGLVSYTTPSFFIRHDTLFTNRAFDYESASTHYINISVVSFTGTSGDKPFSLSKTLQVDISDSPKDCEAEIIPSAVDPLMITTESEGVHYTWQNHWEFLSNERTIYVPFDGYNLPKIRATVTYENGCSATSEFYCGSAKPRIIPINSLTIGLPISIHGATYHWYKDAVMVYEGSQRDFTITGPGTYQVRVSSEGCFSAMSDPFNPDLACNVPVISWNYTPFHTLLTASFGNTFNWRSASGGEGIVGDWRLKTVIVDKPGVYTVTIGCNGGSVISAPFEVTACMLQGIEAEASVTTGGEMLTANEGLGYKWFLNGQQLPYNTQSILITSSGTYQAEVTFGEECTALSEPVLITETSSSLSNDLNIYFDRAENAFVVAQKEESIMGVKVFDSNGRLLHISSSAENARGIPVHINVGSLSTGLYILHVISTNGFYPIKWMER